MNTNTRDIGLSHGAGKGSANRSNHARFSRRFPDKLTGNVDGFERHGRRLVKHYGPRAEVRIRSIPVPPLSAHYLSKVCPDFAVAQRIADETNAGFRARGIDTAGR